MGAFASVFTDSYCWQRMGFRYAAFLRGVLAVSRSKMTSIFTKINTSYFVVFSLHLSVEIFHIYVRLRGVFPISILCLHTPPFAHAS